MNSNHEMNGRLGGLARAAALSPARRAEIARQAAMARQEHRGWPAGKKRPERRAAAAVMISGVGATSPTGLRRAARQDRGGHAKA